MYQYHIPQDEFFKLSIESKPTSFYKPPKQEHFDGGDYEFRRIILQLELNEIHLPIPAKRLHRIYPENDLPHYYARFLPLICEEARAIIHEGIQRARKDNSYIPAIVHSCNLSKNPENPSTISASFELSGQDYGTSEVVLLIQHIKTGQEFLGLASQKESLWSIKIITGKVLEQDLNRKDLQIAGLGSLVTLKRMYVACKAAYPSSTLKSICCHPLPAPLVPKADLSILERAMACAMKLNHSQYQAIQSIINSLSRVTLLQGPPGTGKTTTIIALIRKLNKNAKRVLVCAPSNKAVQIIASRLFSQNPDIPMLVMGVEEKLMEELKPIFLYTWKNFLNRYLAKLDSAISSLSMGDELRLEDIEKHANVIHKIEKLLKTPPPSLSLIGVSKIKDKSKEYNSVKINITMVFRGKHDPEQAILSAYCQFLKNYELELREWTNEIKLASNKSDMDLVNSAQVIFSTLSVAGRNLSQEKEAKILRVDYLIVDEAAQALEAETLIPFCFKPRKLVLVGDTKQLPAVVISDNAKSCRFDWSMMYRLEQLGIQPLMLTTQYRMHPEIRGWPSKQYYNSSLQDDKTIHERPPIPLLDPRLGPYVFFDITSGEESRMSSSSFNLMEVQYAIELVKLIQRNAPTKSIGVITFYAAQAKKIKEKLSDNDALVSTVDGFQGDECDFIIISFVRNNRSGSIGFLDDFRRLNVALTRAKESLIMLGNVNTLMKSGSSDLKGLCIDAESRKKIVSEQTLQALFIQNEKERKPSPRKAVPCRFFKTLRGCDKGNNCTFAHEQKENQGAKTQ